jgi:DNA-binding MarR family transcriptional regulator
MNDKNAEFPDHNIRSLLERVAHGLDLRLEAYRKGTRYEGVRPSDVKVFVLAMLKPRTTADIARLANVSRQAIHSSIGRLADLGIVNLQFEGGNHRDKIVVVTERGKTARDVAIAQSGQLEEECAAIIGAHGLEQLRDLLAALNNGIGRDAPIHADIMQQKQQELERQDQTTVQPEG